MLHDNEIISALGVIEIALYNCVKLSYSCIFVFLEFELPRP